MSSTLKIATEIKAGEYYRSALLEEWKGWHSRILVKEYLSGNTVESRISQNAVEVIKRILRTDFKHILN